MKDSKKDIRAELILLAVRGDQKARYQLYKQYAKAMYNVSIRMVQSREDAEDILQDSFVAAFENLSDFKGSASFGAWLKRIVINRSINFLKKKNKEKIVLEEFSFDCDEKEEINISSQKIQQSIKDLPQGARVILNLYLLENYKHKEIAKMLEISESTSKSQYRRAIRLLKQKLIQDED